MIEIYENQLPASLNKLDSLINKENPELGIIWLNITNISKSNFPYIVLLSDDQGSKSYMYCSILPANFFSEVNLNDSEKKILYCSAPLSMMPGVAYLPEISTSLLIEMIEQIKFFAKNNRINEIHFAHIFDDQRKLIEALILSGFKIKIDNNMMVIKNLPDSFDEYFSLLKKDYRKKLKTYIKVFKEGGLRTEVQYITKDSIRDFIEYHNLSNKQRSTPSFFDERLFDCLDLFADYCYFVYVYCGNKVIAITLCLANKECISAKFFSFDYSYSFDLKIYQNTCLKIVSSAIEMKKRVIFFGQDDHSGITKKQIGCIACPQKNYLFTQEE